MSADAKNYFLKAFEIDEHIAKLEEDLVYLRYKQEKPAGGSLGLGLGVQKSLNRTAIEDLTIKILETEEKIAKANEELFELESKIYYSCRQLPPKQRAIILWRYICRHPWKTIVKRAELSEMQILRIHSEAMEAILFY